MLRSILLLDDEEHIRSDLKNYLNKKGYTIFAASTEDEAIKIILIITDLGVSYFNITFSYMVIALFITY